MKVQRNCFKYTYHCKKLKFIYVLMEKFSAVSITKNRSILQLPNEILINILKYLSNYDIHHSVAFVCKKFNELSMDPIFILEIYINQYKLHIGMERPYLNYPSQKSICDFLTRSRYLTKLTIEDREDIEILVLNALKSCPKLTILEIIARPEDMKKISDVCIVSMYQWSDNLHF